MDDELEAYWKTSEGMVLYFECDLIKPPCLIYMGADKYENEELIRWGWPEDVWFHVDKLSSAHVYLRLPPGTDILGIPDMVIQDCAQLVKANSIQGNKMNNIDVVYTKWENLKKTGDMAVGQVGFHKGKEVHKIHVEKRVPEVVKRLEKTKKEEFPDLRALREERDSKERAKTKEAERERRRTEKEELERREADKKMRSYDTLFTNANMRTNEDGYDSDDFM